MESQIHYVIKNKPNIIEMKSSNTPMIKKRKIHFLLKRIVDIIGSSIGLVSLAPIFLMIGILIKLFSKGPIFYKQTRLGKGGQLFGAWKFRSMVDNADVLLEKYLVKHPEYRTEWEKNHKLKNDPRVNFFGKILRKSSLDELPQLWNILIGEMSLVGPRPIVEKEIVKYGDAYKAYKLVKPGLTGLWQISGRSNLSYDERVKLDMEYIETQSIILDLKIIIKTIPAIFRTDEVH